MNAWVFDVDGVLTNIHTKKVEEPELISEICKILINEPVGIITGKRYYKTLEDVVYPIRKVIKNPFELDNLHVESEFGSVGIDFENGNEKIYFDTSFKLPDDLTKNGKEIIEEFKEYVFFNEKKFFFTAEKNTNFSYDDFKKIQSKISKELQELVESMNLTNEIEVHQDTIAINVKNKKLNKHHATKNLLKWMGSKKINPNFFYVFGDSESDFQIGEELFSQNKKIEFIYTGEKDFKEKPFKVNKIGKFDKGTLNFLQENS